MKFAMKFFLFSCFFLCFFCFSCKKNKSIEAFQSSCIIDTSIDSINVLFFNYSFSGITSIECNQIKKTPSVIKEKRTPSIDFDPTTNLYTDRKSVV